MDVDGRLDALGIHRIALPVPFPDAGGPVNVYVLEEEDGFSLFDAGIGTEEGVTGLDEGLSRLGLSPSGLRRIFISHGHVDHYGQAQRLAEQSGATVHVHPADQAKVAAPSHWNALRPVYDAYLAQLGLPESELPFVEALRDAAEQAGRRVDPERLRPLLAGERLPFRHFQAEVHHFPGHTPGLVALYLPQQRILLADDHVLARVSPNPLLDLSAGPGPKFKALVSYLESARRALALPLDWVLPGHGPPFQEVRAVLEGLFAFYERRQEFILRSLSRTPASAYELIPVVFGRRDPLRLFLTLSEVIGNLEVLEDAGRVTRALEGGIYRFRVPTTAGNG